MSVKNKEIAERMKAIRDLSVMPLVDMAKELDMPLEEYQAYEMGEAEIPVSLLYEVCKILKISMTELLTGDKARLSVYSVSRKGRGLNVERNSAYNYQNLAYEFAQRKVEPLLVNIPPESDGVPVFFNSHHGQEYHYCMEGRFKLYIDKHEVIVNEGDSVYFDSTYPHHMRALDGKPARILVVVI